MAYTHTDYKSKKALKEAVANGETVTVYQPNGDFTGVATPDNGKVYLEGPHYPKPHTWYAEAWLEGGKVVRVK